MPTIYRSVTIIFNNKTSPKDETITVSSANILTGTWTSGEEPVIGSTIIPTANQTWGVSSTVATLPAGATIGLTMSSGPITIFVDLPQIGGLQKSISIPKEYVCSQILYGTADNPIWNLTIETQSGALARLK